MSGYEGKQLQGGREGGREEDGGSELEVRSEKKMKRKGE